MLLAAGREEMRKASLAHHESDSYCRADDLEATEHSLSFQGQRKRQGALGSLWPVQFKKKELAAAAIPSLAERAEAHG